MQKDEPAESEKLHRLQRTWVMGHGLVFSDVKALGRMDITGLDNGLDKVLEQWSYSQQNEIRKW